jgi:hypothetical protein
MWIAGETMPPLMLAAMACSSPFPKTPERMSQKVTFSV